MSITRFFLGCPRRWALIFTLLFAGGGALAQTAVPDLDFDVSVTKPTYIQTHPLIVIDEAHNNYHTAEGRYRPLAQLLRNDGYDVELGTSKFEAAGLSHAQVLIVANALGGEDRDAPKPAFTSAECDAVRDWVRGGGSLLLIADHAPFGSAAYDLADRFGVQMGKGFVFDRQNSYGDPTILVFSLENGLLGKHPVTLGRNDTERIKRVVAFTGQSLSVPPGATALMRLSPSAYEAASYAEGKAGNPDASHSLGERAQGIAMEFGKGRAIIVGEAAMFSAQRMSFKSGAPDFRFGMNASGNDDRQFALNALHWLSSELR